LKDRQVGRLAASGRRSSAPVALKEKIAAATAAAQAASDDAQN
jgi:hypothetical protein